MVYSCHPYVLISVELGAMVWSVLGAGFLFWSPGQVGAPTEGWARALFQLLKLACDLSDVVDLLEVLGGEVCTDQLFVDLLVKALLKEGDLGVVRLTGCARFHHQLFVPGQVR